MTAFWMWLHGSLLIGHYHTAFFSEGNTVESILLHTFPSANITSQSFLLPPVEEAGETLISEWRLLSLATLAPCWSEHSSPGMPSVSVCVHTHV